MKIFVDAHLFDHSLHQGSRTYLKELYNRVAVQAPEIEFFFGASNLAKLKSEIVNLSNVHFVQYRSSNKYVRLLLEIPILVWRLKIDYAHYQYISPVFKFSKEIVTVHDLLFLDFPKFFPVSYRIIKNFLFRRSAKRADLLLTVSKYSKDSISRNYRINKDKIFITPNGVDFTAPVVDGLKEDIHKKYALSKYLLYVGRIEPRKNHISLLRAYNELQLWSEGYQLVMIGKRSIESVELNEYYAKLDPSIKQHIKFLEDIPQAELISFYSNCSLFVFPSYAEGFGIPPLEAIALGAPTLCSETTAMSEFFFLGDQLFNPNNISELKDKIRRNLEIPLSDTSISSFSRHVKENYSWNNSARLFITYLNLVNKMRSNE